MVDRSAGAGRVSDTFGPFDEYLEIRSGSLYGGTDSEDEIAWRDIDGYWQIDAGLTGGKESGIWSTLIMWAEDRP